MILESILSCSYLLLACGTSIHTLIQESRSRYGKVLPYFASACFGIAAVGARSLFVLVYKLFLKSYTFDPVQIEREERRNKCRVNVLDQILESCGMATMVYSLFCRHDYYLLGAPIIVGISALKLRYFVSASQFQEYHPEDLNDRLYWILFGGYFSHHVGNYYGLLANYPYLITVWALPPEAFYQGWTIRRTINDYMMTVYVILMTEALRPPL